MTTIKLPDSGAKIQIKSYKAPEQDLVEKWQEQLTRGEITLFTFRKNILELVYPDMNPEEMTAADLAYLTGIIIRYSAGGPEAIKNLLTSGSGIQEVD